LFVLFSGTLPAFEGCVSRRAEHTPSVTQPIAGNFGHLRDVVRNIPPHEEKERAARERKRQQTTK